METLLELWPYALLVVAAIYLLAPLPILAALGEDVHPTYEVFDATKHVEPEAVTAFVRDNVAPLVAAGFAVVGDLVRRRPAAQGTRSTRVTMLENAASERATVAVVYTDRGAAAPMVEFTAEVSGGRMLDVNNSVEAPVFGAVPGHVTERFPSVRDPVRLYRIFRALLRKGYGAPTLKRRDIGGDPARVMAEIMNEGYKDQIATGYFRLDAGAQRYRATLKGAYLMTWKLLPPIGALRRRGVKRRAAALLRELRLEGEDQRPVPAVTKVT